MVLFLKKKFKLLIFEAQKLAQNELNVNWHAQFRFWHVVQLVKKKTHTSIDMLEIEIIRITRHVTLRWHFGGKCRCPLTFFFSFLFFLTFWKRHMPLWIWSWMSNEICQIYTLFVITNARMCNWSLGYYFNDPYLFQSKLFEIDHHKHVGYQYFILDG